MFNLFDKKLKKSELKSTICLELLKLISVFSITGLK